MDRTSQIMQFEGFHKKPYWDVRQWTVGYGTRANGPNDYVDESEARKRLARELSQSRSLVDRHAPNAPSGVKDALTSLTFNAGDKWSRSGLGDALRRGDMADAKSRFLQYVKADGRTLPGLVKRRQAEAQWWDSPEGTMDFSVKNLVGKLNETLEPTRAKYAGDNGRLDPYAISAHELVSKYGIDPEVASDMGPMSGVAQLRRDMLGGAINKPEKTWGNTLGALLQAVAIPVSYHQNNGQYGAMLSKDNIMTDYANKLADYEKTKQAADIKTASSYVDSIDAAMGASVARRAATRQAARDEIRWRRATGRPISKLLLSEAGLGQDGGDEPTRASNAEAAPFPAANPEQLPGTVVTPPAPPSPVGSGGDQATPTRSRGYGPDGVTMDDVSYWSMRDPKKADAMRKMIENDPNYIADVERGKKRAAADVELDTVGDIEKRKVSAKKEAELEDAMVRRKKQLSSINYALDQLGEIANTQDPQTRALVNSAVGPLEGNETFQSIRSAVTPRSFGYDQSYETNQNIRQYANTVKAVLGSAMFKGEGPLSEGERALAGSISREFTNVADVDALKAASDRARDLVNVIVDWERDGAPKDTKAWRQKYDAKRTSTQGATGRTSTEVTGALTREKLRAIPEDQPIKYNGQWYKRVGGDLIPVEDPSKAPRYEVEETTGGA